jgi:hypothetical protein
VHQDTLPPAGRYARRSGGAWIASFKHGAANPRNLHRPTCYDQPAGISWPAIGVKAYLAARPVYRFKDDLKGVVLKAALREVAIEGSTVAITVSVVNLTVIPAMFVATLPGVAVLIIWLIRHPAWGRPASSAAA